MLFRTRVPEQPPVRTREETNKLRLIRGEEDRKPTRRGTMTGTPGSAVERRAPPEGDELNLQIPIRHRKVTAEAEVKRSRAVSGNPKRFGKLKVCQIDRLDRNLSLVGGNTNVKRFNREIKTKTEEIYRPRNSPLLTTKYTLVDNQGCYRFMLTTGTIRMFRDRRPWTSAFCKLCKIFGPISKDRHFRFALKYITFAGASAKDLYKLVRIRDLWLRESRKYRKAMCSFNHSLNKDVRNYICSLPKKKVNPVRSRSGS